MDRIKRLSYEVLEKHKSKFGVDFTDNKKALDQVAIVRSKGLKNEITGYITKFIKREIREEKEKQLQIAAANAETMEEISSDDKSSIDSTQTSDDTESISAPDDAESIQTSTETIQTPDASNTEPIQPASDDTETVSQTPDESSKEESK